MTDCYHEACKLMHRRKSCYPITWMAIIAMMLLGCKEDNNRKPTFPVTGTVHVDGKPAEAVRVEIYDVKGLDPKQPTYSSAFTDAEGKFALSTYENGDGVPEGEYALTYMWGKLNVMSMQYGGPDKLNNKYSDAKKTPFKIKVEAGKPTDLGVVDLKTR